MFVEVILPVPMSQLFTYRVSELLQPLVKVGVRVVVQFGAKRFISGVVKSIHHDVERVSGLEIKDIFSVLDDQPLVTPQQFQFWEWIADYYQCSIGEVYKAAIPAGLKLESETKIYLSEAFVSSEIDHEQLQFTGQEKSLLELLAEADGQTISELADQLERKSILSILKSLLEKGVIATNEELKGGFKAKEEKFVILNQAFCSDEALNSLLNRLSRAPKQLQLLLDYLHITNYSDSKCIKEVSCEELLNHAASSSTLLKELIKKEIFNVVIKEASRLEVRLGDGSGIKTLNTNQQIAYDEIKSQFKTKDVVLLHGVTSSGKTEIYFHLIEECLAQGKQALYLLPEIALTTQITTRLSNAFGDKVGIFHSKFSDAERVEVYRNILSGGSFQIILGVRSAIFLPFNNLGLIIVDEEHENTFKQFDPAPRYHARDSAYVLTKLFGAKMLLGSATPSVESYYNAKQGKIGMVQLLTRYADIKMPQIVTVDVKELKRKKIMNSTFSPMLLGGIQKALENKEQVILFQNRRGFSPFVECMQCGYVPKCVNCDVSMTYHKSGNRLVCHYCGVSYVMISTCKACNGHTMQTVGFGTQKIEEEIKIIFPQASVARMDTDTTSTRKGFERLIHDFETKKVDILIGTQMISKGLDFKDVSLVGILNADSMLNIPDFRSHERGFQLMAQVSGRAGRKNKQGLVIIQSYDVNHPVILDVLDNNFEAHFTTQLREREIFKYPPFVRLIALVFKHKDEETVHQAAQFYAKMLRDILGSRVFGPQIPHVARIQNYYIRKLLFKFESTDSLPKAKTLIKEATVHLAKDSRFKSVQVVVDVDPM